MKSAEALLQACTQDAATAPSLWLPRQEPHPAGLVVGFVGLSLGAVSVRWPWLQTQPFGAHVLGWLALALCAAGMFMHWAWPQRRAGWLLDFEAGLARPVGLPGELVAWRSTAYRLACQAGRKRNSLAIELRAVDGGLPVAVFQTRARASLREHQGVSALADALAQRMGLERVGVQF